jgi:hypothetical protein
MTWVTLLARAQTPAVPTAAVEPGDRRCLHHAAMLSRRSHGTNLYADCDLRWAHLRPFASGLREKYRGSARCWSRHMTRTRTPRVAMRRRFFLSEMFGKIYAPTAVRESNSHFLLRLVFAPTIEGRLGPGADVSTLEVLTTGVLNLRTMLPEMSCAQGSRRRLCITRPFSKKRFSG